MMFDGVALAAAVSFMVAKAASRKYTGKSVVRLDDVVGALQIYAAIVTVRNATAPTQIPAFGKEQV
jgi:hypothetical protein